MLVPKKNRVEVYKYLFKEGVLYAKKDYSMPKHPEIDVPNLHVIKLMQSFTSKEFVKEQYAWQHYYWMLTDEGIEHLRQYLNIPADVVPATLKKSSRPATAGRPGAAPPGGDRPRRFGDGGDRGGYRGGGDKGGAPGEYQPRFGGGFGRGGPPK
mmetsp:Transcript_8504/g.29786  ORF Transcript_8504/g.29786 Transcript_8504/m.29786 type:complete len:154 (-) Transcript_8504:272-733(-)